MIKNTDNISHLQTADDIKYGRYYPSINKLTMTQRAAQLFDA
jgi:hypothetical protein